MDMNLMISPFPAIFTSIIFIIFISLLHKLIWNKSNPVLNLPPGPWKLPIIGNVYSLIGATLHHRLAELAYKYGPLMYFKFGELPVVVVSSPETARQFMKVHDINFASRPHTMVGEIFFHNNSDILLAPYGEYWRQTKKVIMVELLTAKRVQTYRSIRQEEVGNMMRELAAASAVAVGESRKPVNLTELIFLTSYRIICAAAFGREVKHAKKFMPIVMELVELTGGLSIALIFPYAKFFEVFKGTKSVLQKYRDTADEILEDILRDHRAAREKGDKYGEEDEEPLVDVLLTVQEQGNKDSLLRDTTINAVLLDCFFGGVHPASTTIEWAMSEMLKNPRVLRKAQAEVRELHHRKGEVLDEADIHELKYLNLVVRETFRMHPPLPLLVARESVTKCAVNGYDIPEKVIVFINAWAIGRDCRIWKDPHTFNPERFQESPINFKGTNFELIPFGSGRRMCPGITFGMASVEFQLANLLCHFDWKLPNWKGTQELDMTEGVGTIVRKKTQLYLIPIPWGGSDLKH